MIPASTITGTTIGVISGNLKWIIEVFAVVINVERSEQDGKEIHY